MGTLASLCAQAETRKVKVRGEDVTVRALSSRETEWVAKVYPMPVPPLGPDPSRSADAPLVARTDNAEYRRLLNEAYRMSGLAVAAIASDWETAEGLRYDRAKGASKADNEAWLRKAVEEVAELHPHDVVTLGVAHTRTPLEDVVKN